MDRSSTARHFTADNPAGSVDRRPLDFVAGTRSDRDCAISDSRLDGMIVGASVTAIFFAGGFALLLALL